MKKRIHEIAKQEGLTSKEVLAALNAAGIEVKVAASSVEESEALKALAAAGATAEPKSAKASSKSRSTPALTTCNCWPSECAAACASVDMVRPAGLSGLTRSATTFVAGSSSRRISRCFCTS